MTAETKAPFYTRIGFLRLVILFVVLAVTHFGLMAATSKLVPYFPRQFRDTVALVVLTLAAALAIFVYRGVVRWLEKRSADELALRPGGRYCVYGFVLALVMFTTVYAVLFGLGDASYQGFTSNPRIALMLAVAIMSGVGEELLFRGAIFRIVEQMFGSGISLIVSAAIFGGLHLVNPNATLFSALAISIEAGIMLAAAYAATRSLWLPIGIHIGWNFTEAGIFSAADSGTSAGRGLFNIPLSGPEWLTGGSFGPEASVVVLAFGAAAGLFFIWRMVRSGNWVPLRARLMLN